MSEWLQRFWGKITRSGAEQAAREAAPPTPRGALSGDVPIVGAGDDLVGRDELAQRFASRLLKLDAKDGFVVAVLGPWGSGKTSFVNLARQHLRATNVPVLDFNPWMFSGAEQLMTAFFSEMAAQLKVKTNLESLAANVESYGEALSDLDWIPGVGKLLKGLGVAAKWRSKKLRKEDGGLDGRRRRIDNELGKLEQPIVVVLDDIDRLSKGEIRDIFRLVRLTASFQNIIYILVFDRERVENALNEDGFKGRAYLEKIVQLVFDLPKIPDPVLQKQTFAALDAAIAGAENRGSFNEQRWPDVYVEVIRPLLRNMRDVRRYAMAVHGTIDDLEGQVEQVDVLALEAIRLFLPDVFALIAESVGALTSMSSDYGHRDSPTLQARVQQVIVAAGTHKEVAEALIRRIFLAASRHIGGMHYGSSREWLKERRVAHGDVLRFYLERLAGEGLIAFNAAEKAFGMLDQEETLERYFRSLRSEDLENVISSLEAYEDEFTAAQVVPAVSVLLNVAPDIPERPRGFLELDTGSIIGRVVYRLLKAVPSPREAEDAVRQILPRLRTLSARMQLVWMVGYADGVGHKMLSEQAAADLERIRRDEMRATPPDVLAREPEALLLLHRLRREAGENEPALVVDANPELTLALLRNARSETKTQSADSRALRRSYRLAWNSLVDLYGSEQTLKERVDQMRHLIAPTDDLMVLVDRYLGGWRPDRQDE